MMGIKKIVEENDTRAGKLFDLFIQSLIILSLISFALETLPSLSEGFRKVLSASEFVIVLMFTFEYLLRIAIADKKLSYIFSFYGIIDLLAILPFYLASGMDLRSLRGLRLLRLVRVFKLFRYTKAIRRLKLAFLNVKEEPVIFLVATALMLFLSAVGIYYCESAAQPESFGSVFHCLWWAVATLTTVGYGDVYPVTAPGKIFTFLMLLIGFGIIAVPTGLIASAFTEIKEEEREHCNPIADLDDDDLSTS